MISDEEARQIKEQLFKQLEKFPEDQREELRQKIESMDNEELEKFVKHQTKEAKQSCIFCEIVKNNIKAYKIYEDNNFLAMLDIMPATHGHTIIIPKQHIQFLTQLSDEQVKEIFMLAKKIIPFIQQQTNCQGVDIYVSQGISQRVPHFSLNLIPRYQDNKDKVNFDWQREKADEKILEQLSKNLSSDLEKIKQKEHEEKQEQKQEREESEAQKMMKHIKERIP